MPDGYVQIKTGEKRPLYGQITAESGTLDIQATPTFTLYDSAGTLVGTADQNVTGYDDAADDNPKVWFLMDTSSFAGYVGALPVGFYTMVFKITAIGSDGMTRIYKPNLGVSIQAVTE